MNYQGEQVNFSQPTMTQYNTANIERINKSMYEYPQEKGLASARSDSDIWKHIGQYIDGTAGSNDHYSWAANSNAIKPKVERNINAIQVMKNQHVSFQNQLNEAKDERDSIQAKLEGKANKNHTHSGGGGGDPEDCGWFGEKCWDNPFEKLFPTVPMTAILAAGGLGVYLLLRKK